MEDFSMLSLFRMEAEAQCAVLNSGLLELESDPSPAKIEPLMRAAHSIKGAARIVGLAPLVKLAHSMEDLLVALGEGRFALRSDHIDILLRGADLLKDLGLAPESEIAARVDGESQKIAELARDITESTQNAPETAAAPLQDISASPPPSHAESHSPPSPEEKPVPAHMPQTEKKSAEHDSTVRISSEKMNRLMAFAAESIVSGKRLQSFEKRLLSEKRSLMEISTLMDEFCQSHLGSSQTCGALGAFRAVRQRLNDFYRSHAENLADFSERSLDADNFSQNLYREVLSCRMRPFSDLAKELPRALRDLAKTLGKKAHLHLEGESVPVDKDVLDKLNAPLSHILRNAIDHGIEKPEDRKAANKDETGKISICARHWAGMLNITVCDDGRGIDPDKILRKAIEKRLVSEEMASRLSVPEILEFMFLPGFSTASELTEISGRGVGLDVVQNMVQDLRGVVRVETETGNGTCFNLNLPISLSVMPALIAKIAGERYAFPLSRIERLLRISAKDMLTIESSRYLRHEAKNIGIVSASEIFGYGAAVLDPEKPLNLVIIGDRVNQYAIHVDGFEGENELVVRPLDPRLGKLPDISSASILEDGTPILIVDADDMIRSIDRILNGSRLEGLKDGSLEQGESSHRKRILVADDSITVREVERNLLVNNGYLVDVAVDGAEAWNAIRSEEYDLLVTDVDMPRMNGIELVSKIKGNDRLRQIPVMIVSYKDRESDRLRGMEAGADYYLAKSSFQDNALLKAVASLIGGAQK